MKTLLTAIFNTLGAINPHLAAAGTAAVSLGSVLTFLSSQLAALIAKVDALAAANFSGTLAVSPAGFLNTFIPLQEAIGMFAAWLTLVASCAVIRIIKAWVPTVAS